MRTSDTFIQHERQDVEIPAEYSDPYEIVADAEEDLAFIYHLNLNGNIMTLDSNLAPTAMAQAMTAATGRTFTKRNYFTPLDVIDEHLELFPVMHSRVLPSLAWRLDSAVISQARNVLFSLYSEAEREGDNPFDNFCQRVAADVDHASLYEDEGPCQTLAQLIALRPTWHDAAQMSLSAADKEYNPKSLDEQMLAEKPRTASIGARMNLELLAAKEARGDDAKKQRLVDAFMKRDEIQALERAKNNKHLIPTISLVIATAARHVPEHVRFDQLPKDVQRSFTRFAVDTIERTLERDVAKLSSVTTLEYGRIVDAAFAANDALREVLNGSLSDIGELEYAGNPPSVDQFERNQKRIAAGTH